MKILLFENNSKTRFFAESKAFGGVKKIASKVIGDFNNVTGAEEVLHDTDETITGGFENAVLFATMGKSSVLESFSDDLKDLAGKNECFKYLIKNDVIPGAKRTLIIAGSDKRGTIYGMFSFSEMMGVTPLVYWGDSVIPHKDPLNVDFFDGFLSKEPSVKYRGFFINDEWPCYGNWTTEHFGGFNAKMYDHVFELLLRLKGNYLWPAMWSSNFAWDGPGLKSYELADEYGVVIGNSHHEPCLRAGAEYGKVRGKDSPYGDAWNFITNPDGIRKFWEDSLNERAHLESVVTVGMRGEADSKILGENATLKDNIDLLRNVITCQKELLATQEARLGHKLPKMLALYKEVEPFYYGDADTEGLCGWKELDDVILMLCEDNHGWLRTLPDEKMRDHPAGFGMYYHVDYHGDPISYEWINSTPIKKIRKEMKRAYESGVRSLWILNVGDLKHNEFPLAFFLQMAYDFEEWGETERCDEFTELFLKNHFGNLLSADQLKKAVYVLTETVDINGTRRPEALNPEIYHPCHYNEADRMLERAEKLERTAEALYKEIPEGAKDAFYSLMLFQTRAAVNLLRMHLYAGKNKLFALQGRKKANEMADLVTLAIERDRAIAKEFSEFADEKWKGMELAPHIGFTKWNEDGCRYPIRMRVEPVNHPRMTLVRNDEEWVYDKKYGAPMCIVFDDFLYEGSDTAKFTVCNTGTGAFDYTITVPDNDWVTFDKASGHVDNEDEITVTVDRSKIPGNEGEVVARVSDGDTVVEVAVKGRKIPAGEGLKLRRFGYILTKDNSSSKDKWIIDAEKEGEYDLTMWFDPVNPPHRDGILEYVTVVSGKKTVANAVHEGYRAGEAYERTWAKGVLDHRRECVQKIFLKKGLNEIEIPYNGNGLYLQKAFVSNEEHKPLASYLGPQI